MWVTNSVTDWAIYWTLDHFLKPLATINLPKSPTFLGIFCKDVKIYHFYCEINFRATFYRHLAIFSGHTVSNTNLFHPISGCTTRWWRRWAASRLQRDELGFYFAAKFSTTQNSKNIPSFATI